MDCNQNCNHAGSQAQGSGLSFARAMLAGSTHGRVLAAQLHAGQLQGGQLVIVGQTVVVIPRPGVVAVRRLFVVHLGQHLIERGHLFRAGVALNRLSCLGRAVGSNWFAPLILVTRLA